MVSLPPVPVGDAAGSARLQAAIIAIASRQDYWTPSLPPVGYLAVEGNPFVYAEADGRLVFEIQDYGRPNVQYVTRDPGEALYFVFREMVGYRPYVYGNGVQPGQAEALRAIDPAWADRLVREDAAGVLGLGMRWEGESMRAAD